MSKERILLLTFKSIREEEEYYYCCKRGYSREIKICDDAKIVVVDIVVYSKLLKILNCLF